MDVTGWTINEDKCLFCDNSEARHGFRTTIAMGACYYGDGIITDSYFRNVTQMESETM
jgi:hypothetical protein